MKLNNKACVVLLLICICAFQAWYISPKWGEILPMIACFSVLTFVLAFVPADTFLRLANENDFNVLMFFFPGYRLISKDLAVSTKGVNWRNAVVFLFILLFFIVSGFAMFSIPNILIKLKILDVDWALLARKEGDGTFLSDWLTAWLSGLIFYLFYCTFLNLLVHMAFAVSHYTQSMIGFRNIMTYFGINNQSLEGSIENEYWKKFSTYSEHIYGHKMWGGKNTKVLLENIIEKKEKLGTSQWFMLEFSAEALDSHINNMSGCVITHDYEHTKHFSNFITSTMSYSTKSIIWIVDQSDFRNTIFPMMVRETIFSLAESTTQNGYSNADITRAKEVIDKINKLKTAINNYEFAYEVSGKFHSNGCKIKCNDTTKCSHSLNTDEAWKEILLFYQNEISIEKIIAYADTNIKTLHDLFDKRGSDSFYLPHVRAYYKHPVPKTRIIDVPPLEHPEDSYTLNALNSASFHGILKRLCLLSEFKEADLSSFASDDQGNTEIIKMLAKKYVKTPDDETNITIFNQAFILFQHVCNGNTNHKTVGFSEVGQYAKTEMLALGTNSTDLGLYDDEVLVNSSVIKVDDKEKRRAIWAINHQMVRKLRNFSPLSDATPNTLVYPLDEFVKELIRLSPRATSTP